MWVDINTHLELMSSPPDQILEDARSVGVSFIATGTHPDQWRWLEGRAPHLAFGLHPHHLDQDCDWASVLEDLLSRHEQSAVGEIGLDFRPGLMRGKETQVRAFESQLELARSFDRAVIIHAVKSHNEVITSLKRVQCERFVIHAFTGSKEIAEAYLSLGGYLSAGGMITRNPTAGTVCFSVDSQKSIIARDRCARFTYCGRETGIASSLTNDWTCTRQRS